MLVPRYDAACAIHGVHEVTSSPSIARSGFVPCASCAADAPLVFLPEALPTARIDNAGENLSARESPERAADGSGKYNLGLRGVQTSLGRDAAGKEHFTYRPITHAEVGSNANMREIAARQGLTPLEGGRYRSLR